MSSQEPVPANAVLAGSTSEVSEQSEERHRLLVVDDDAQIRRFLQRYLGHEGFDVVTAANGSEMRRMLAGGDIDLIILDVGMPGDDGLTLTRELRRTSQVGIIILTGLEGSAERVVGLELGADDYVSKPFDERELVARIRTVLRRLAVRDVEGGVTDRKPIVFDAFIIDLDRRELLHADGGAVALTTFEFDLLSVLVRHPRQPLSREMLLEQVAGRVWTPDDRAVDTAMVKLRRKLESDPRHPSIIKTVRGVGYLFAPDTTPAP